MTPAFQPPGLNLIQVYRLVDCATNDHVYTIDANEADVLTQQGTHQYEGPAFRILGNQLPGPMPLFRLVSANGRTSWTCRTRRRWMRTLAAKPPWVSSLAGQPQASCRCSCGSIRKPACSFTRLIQRVN